MNCHHHSAWFGRLTRLAEKAPGFTNGVLRFLKGGTGVRVVRALATVALLFWPRLGLGWCLRVLRWAADNPTSDSAQQHSEDSLRLEVRKPRTGNNQFAWLLESLDKLPRKRKAQLLALAVSQAARASEPHSANHYGRSDGRGSPRLDCLILAMTDACNLRCAGCYAKPVWSHRHVQFSQLDYITSEAERMGAAAVFITGWGEPFYDRTDKRNLFRLAQAYPAMMFAAFTNATLITEDDLKALDRLGNLILLVSLDGLEATNDGRRGQGVFRRVAQTASQLKCRGMVFGMSVTVTSANYREVTSAEFVDTVRAWGAMWVLYLRFTLYPQPQEGAWLNLAVQQATEYSGLLESARQRQPMPLVDADEAEGKFGGCRAQQGSLAFVDAVTGRISACVKLPFAPPSHNLLDNPRPGRLAELLQSAHFRAFWQQFPDGWQCCEGCRLKQAWGNATPAGDLFIERSLRRTPAQ